MRFYTHIAGAAFFFILFAYLLEIPQPMLGIVFAAWISVFPDIIDKLVGKHRGIGHSIFWLIPLFILLYFNITIPAALIIGFLSHLFLDIFTTKGCPILYPLRKTNFVCLNHKRRIKTGTNQDKSVFIFIIFLIFPLIFFSIFSGSITNLGNDAYWGVSASKFNNNTTSVENYFTLNFRLDEANNKNVTVEKVNDQVTTVIIKDLPVTTTIIDCLLYLQIRNPNQLVPHGHA
jgi:inner membrane protein